MGELLHCAYKESNGWAEKSSKCLKSGQFSENHGAIGKPYLKIVNSGKNNENLWQLSIPWVLFHR